MNDRRAIFVCGTLQREVVAALAAEDLTDIEIVGFPCECGQQAGSAKAFDCVWRARANEFSQLLVLGEPCVPAAQLPAKAAGRANVRFMASGFDLFLPKVLVQKYQREAAYLLTPGWLANWPERLKRWGFDQATAEAFFAESCARLVLLDTGTDARSATQLAAFAAFVNLPSEIVPVGLEMLRLRLAQHWRDGAQIPSVPAAGPAGTQPAADYAMVFDLLSRPVGFASETEVVRGTFELFEMLCAPAGLAYLPFRDGQAGEMIVSPGATGTSAELAERLAGLRSDCTWLAGKDGFVVRLQRNGETLGALLVERVALPHRKADYLNLTLTILPVLSLAIASARNLERLIHSKAALHASEKRFKKLFEEAPLGIALIDSLTGHIHEVNPTFARIAGRSMEEMANIDWRSLTHSDDIQEGLDNMALLNAGKLSGFQMEKRYLHPDGTAVWINMTIAPVQVEDKAQPRHLCMIEDITERKRAEAALRLSEERFRIVAETANDVIYEWDLKQSVEWQGQIDDLLGYEPGEFPRTLDGWAASVHPEDLERTMAATQAHLEGRAPFASEYRIRGKDGVYRWWSEQGAATRTRDGKPTRLIGSITDITERKRVETALRASEAKFRAMAEAMPQMVWVTRPDGWNIYFSQQWMDYTGLTLEESLGHGWNKPFHPEDQQRAWDAWQHATTTIGAYSVECRLRRADGAYRWWLIRGVPQQDASGNILKWFGTCTDIHDLKLAEMEISRANRELHESEEKFRQLAASITDVFYLTSPDLQQMHYVNPAYEQIWGRSVESLYANPSQWTEAILPEDRERVWTAFSRLATGAASVSAEFRIARPDGTVRWILSRGFQVRDVAGKVIRITGNASDITERKRVQGELDDTHRQLVEASRRCGMAEIATNVLHNVGNVLNSVNVSADYVAGNLRKSKVVNLSKVVALLQEHDTDLAAFLSADPKGRQLPGYLAQLATHLAGEQTDALKELADLQKNIEHIKEIVAMQQSYATFGGVKEIINVVNLVEDSLGMNAVALSRHRVQIVREFETVPPLNVERHKLLQILVNLVSNAKHACEDSERADKRITVRVGNGAGWIKISVMDNGVGIPAENLTRIFNQGFTTRKDGHGFGLHSGALAAREMGGSLTVRSDGPGRGAVFTLELPSEPPKQESPEAERIQPGFALNHHG